MNKSIIGQSVGFALVAILACSGCDTSESPPGAGPTGGAPQGKRDIVQVASQMGAFSTLVSTLNSTGLSTTLKGRGPYTLFAPTDDAFTRLPPGTMPSLTDPKNRDQLRDVLTYHIVPGRLTETELRAMRVVRTLSGKDLPITVVDGKVQVGTATVTGPAIETDNGVIYPVDTVLIPK